MDASAMLATVEGTVRMYASKYARGAGGDLGVDDLMQVGRVAALLAAPSFDPSKGATFATYVRLPVETAIRNAVRKMNPRLSLDAKLGEGEETYGSMTAAEETGADEAMATGERDAKVRALVKRVTAEFESHREMAALLVERLMDGEMVEARFRSDTSLAEIAEKFGCTRQNVGNIEKKLKARLAVELKAVW